MCEEDDLVFIIWLCTFKQSKGGGRNDWVGTQQAGVLGAVLAGWLLTCATEPSFPFLENSHPIYGARHLPLPLL